MRGLALALVFWPAAFAFGADAPSRPPSKGCAWEKISDSAVGLEAWVQRCDYGYRKIDFLFDRGALAIRFSDGGGPDPLVETFELLPGETGVAAARRIFAAHTDKSLAARCVLATYREVHARARKLLFVRIGQDEPLFDEKTLRIVVPQHR